MLLDIIVENPFMASAIIFVSSAIVLLVFLRPLVAYVVAKTQTKRDDEIMEALYGAIDKHKEEVEAIHKAAKKAKEKKCKKS